MTDQETQELLADVFTEIDAAEREAENENRISRRGLEHDVEILSLRNKGLQAEVRFWKSMADFWQFEAERER